MTAEPIANVIDDLRTGRIRPALDDPRVVSVAYERMLGTDTVVDATGIYQSLVAKEQPIDLYGDHPCIASPWEHAALCYVNDHGNVVVQQVTARPWPEGMRWDTPNEIDWDELGWLLEVFYWVGGRGGDGALVPTIGPCHMMQYALSADGAPEDMHYVHLVPDYPLHMWEMAGCTFLAAMNFLNCKNVEVSEPKRRRPVRRRLDRLGVRVQTPTVRPLGRRSGGASGNDPAVPLHSVRGHFAEYGPKYGKGKLFGRLEGRYWIPAHARGSADEGEIRKDYVLKP